MGGGFMADNKDMTMQQQAINNNKQQKKKPLLQQQQQDLPRHSHQAFCPANPNPKLPPSSVPPSPSPAPPPPSLKRKTPDPPLPLPSTSSPPPTSSPSLPSKPHKKKLLKVILKVPHSSPSSSSPSSSPPSPPPLSRPSPRSPSLSHHSHHTPLLSPSPSPSPSPSAPPSPSLPPSSQAHLQHRQKPAAELHQSHLLQPPRPSKPPLQPLPQQIKHPPLDPKQQHLLHLHKKSHQLRQVHQKGDHSTLTSLSEQQSNPIRQQNQAHIPSNPSRPKSQQEDPAHSPSKLQHRENPVNSRVKHLEHANPCCARETENDYQVNTSSAKWVDQAHQADLARTKWLEQPDEASPSRIKCTEQVDEKKLNGVKWTESDEANHCRAKHIEPIDRADLSRTKRLEPVDQASPWLSKQTEQVDESNHSRVKRAEPVDQAHPSCVYQTEQVDPSLSRSKRLEARQLDEEAIPKRPQRHQEQQEVQNTGPYPKRLRTLQQSLQDQTNQGLGSPRVQQHRLPQSSSQQQTVKKLTQIPVQGAHVLHQSPKTPSLPIQASSPHPLLPSTSASLQSSAPSLSTSALSDEAQKPSKKRKLRSLLEPEFIHGHSLSDHINEEQRHNTPLTPATTPADNSPVVKPRYESQDSKERAAASSSPKANVHGSLLVPARKLLKGILDRLQKKDKFGVFAEPVNKNEVPNYYDIIKDPMDFGTMRNRISSGYYVTVDLFQKDIFLICDNAMNYNGKGTVYFRHARSIKDIAERILEDLKVSGVSMEMDEPMARQKNGSSGRLTDKHDSCMNAGSPSETRVDNLDDFSGYLVRTAGLIDGRRFTGIDENRRSTYMPISSPFQSNDPLLTTISGDSSHFVPTGYQMDFPYAKSLARFAADLGPSVWKVAAEKIRRALPPSFPFGPGWVGERETPGGIVIAPSTKQQLQGQPSAQQTPKSQNENGAAALTTTGNPPANQPKLGDQLHLQAGHSQESVDQHTGTQAKLQATAKTPNEIRSPMVFGNSLVHNERPNRHDQQALAQPTGEPMIRLHNSENSRPPLQVSSPADQESMAKLDQVSGGAGGKSKFATQVNLNHPLSFQPEEGATIDDTMKGKEDRESRVNTFLPVPSNAVIPATNAGCLALEGNPIKGGAYTSRAPQLDRVNSVKGINGEVGLAGMNVSARNQFDGRLSSHLSRLSSLNQSPNEEASSNAKLGGKSNVFNHFDSFHSSRGSLLPHNLNLPAQQSAGNNHLAPTPQDANLSDPMRPNSSNSHLTQGLALPRNLNIPVQQSSSNSQQPISSIHVHSRDTSPVESGLLKQAPPCSEQAAGERFREAGDFREKEMSGPVCSNSTLTGMMPKKGFVPEKAFMMHHLESRNGQVSSHDLGSPNNQSLDQLNRRQNASVGLSASGFPPGLPTSNGAFRVREESRLPGWVPAQQSDPSPVSGKGGMKMHNQIMRNPAEQQEVTLGNAAKPQNMRLASVQLQGSQNPQAYGYGNQKLVSSMPHFLQQQLSHNTHLPIQHQQMQLHLQNSTLKPGVQNSSPSESRDPKFGRQFQVPSHRVAGMSQAGNSGWQSMPPQMISQGPRQPFVAAPDLNVSLPLTKSPFDQPNGNDIQQPDLALQL